MVTMSILQILKLCAVNASHFGFLADAKPAKWLAKPTKWLASQGFPSLVQLS
jgi:hypothetical protein